MNFDVVLIDIIGDVVNAMSVPGVSFINYEPGRNIQILKSLNDNDESTTYKDKKYPLIAMVLPIREHRGISVGYFATVRIPRIVIATLTNSTDDVLTRYQSGGTFKQILYPCYNEFLNQLSKSKDIIGNDPAWFEHDKMDNPGTMPIGQGTSDYVDTIEILNLELTLNQIKTC